MREPSYRFKQILYWLYKKRVDSFDLMTNMPKTTRVRLGDAYSIEKLAKEYLIESQHHDAVKFGFRTDCGDGIIESVILFDSKRRTLCISSQLGCGLGCLFCETGKMGFVRNLSQHEVLGQLIAANDYLESRGDKTITNIVFMGMGEALSNFEILMTVLEIIMHNDGFCIGGRRITVSTAGVIPSIRRLMETGLNVGLAISLNAYNNKQRDILMPVNKKYPLEKLMAIAAEYHKTTGQEVTFEYVTIAGENDTPEAVDALASLLRKVPCTVNVIPLNPFTGATLPGPTDNQLNAFAKSLAQRGLAVTIRKSRGRDICGACGQLAGRGMNHR
jgi:23S rRNA (adenine2503-C2)-methyltransferase